MNERNGHMAASARDAARRGWPLLLLAAGLAAFFALGGDQWLSFESLRQHRLALLMLVDAHPVLARAGYVALYVLVVALSLPGGAVMTLTGGFLYGAVEGALLAVAGATLGATALFLAARTSLGEMLAAKAGPAMTRMREGFRGHAMSYMLALRLIPLFPFFLVNLVPALLGVPLRVYLVATFFGIMPGALVYALAGAGLGGVFDRGETFSMASVMTPQMLGALVGMGVLALLPVLWKRVKRVPDGGGA